jgi:Uma2 family endonuclease
LRRDDEMSLPSIQDPVKYEVIDGVIYNMSSSPNRRHAIVNGNIFAKLKDYFKDSRCELFMEQLDYYYHYEKDKKDYIIPDIAIVCDWAEDDRHYTGVPGFVAETLSPSTGHRDKTIKKDIYLKNGVEEYWLIDPNGSIEIYYLKDGIYVLEQSFMYDDDEENESYNAQTVLRLRKFPHVEIKLCEIFAY